jgi:hypothetical protein
MGFFGNAASRFQHDPILLFHSNLLKKDRLSKGLYFLFVLLYKYYVKNKSFWFKGKGKDASFVQGLGYSHLNWGDVFKTITLTLWFYTKRLPAGRQGLRNLDPFTINNLGG